MHDMAPVCFHCVLIIKINSCMQSSQKYIYYEHLHAIPLPSPNLALDKMLRKGGNNFCLLIKIMAIFLHLSATKIILSMQCGYIVHVIFIRVPKACFK